MRLPTNNCQIAYMPYAVVTTVSKSPYNAGTSSHDFWLTQASASKIRNAARYGYCA